MGATVREFRSFPLPFVLKDEGELIVPEDLSEDDCLIIEAVVAAVRAYATQRQKAKEAP